MKTQSTLLQQWNIYAEYSGKFDRNVLSMYNKGDLPFAKSGMGSLYMIAMCYVIEKNYCEAAKRFLIFLIF